MRHRVVGALERASQPASESQGIFRFNDGDMFVHLFVCLFYWRTGRANLCYRIEWKAMRHRVVGEFEPASQPASESHEIGCW